MHPRAIVSAILKLWVLAMIAVALYFLWQERVAPPLASAVEAAEQVKHTNVEVRVGAMRKMSLHDYIVAFGTVEPEPATAQSPAAQADITVDWPAVVSEVRCVEGQAVTKGQALLVAKGNTINSPIGGTIVALNIHPGEVALPTTTAVKIVDLNRLIIAAGIPAWQISQISPGQAAHIQLPNGHQQLDGKVQRIDRAADPNTNLVSVDLTIPENSNLRPGQLVQISIIAKEIPDALVVPADAIVRDSQDIPHIALVSDDHKQATLKRITPGLREGDWVQITDDGLAPEQAIVTGGAYGLLPKTDITIVNP